MKRDHSNRAYVLTHGVSGVEWSHYKHPLPEHVYDVYMRYWGDVRLYHPNDVTSRRHAKLYY
ncbi:MAG: hypothetical protein ACXV5N_10970 [Halobacteriota archaeon]